jgi:acyl carrier protein
MSAVGIDTIQSWLRMQIAVQLGIEPEHIDIFRPFTEYGLDSIVGVSLAGDLEEWLDLALSPTLLWDYPSIATLARHLADAIDGSPARAASQYNVYQTNGMDSCPDAEEAEQLLARLDDLSNPDVDALLADLFTAEAVQV